MAKVNYDPQDPGEGTIWFDYFSVVDPTIRPSKAKLHPGIIVGSIIGPLLFMFVVVSFFLWRRRKQKQDEARLKPQLNLEIEQHPEGALSMVFLKIIRADLWI